MWAPPLTLTDSPTAMTTPQRIAVAVFRQALIDLRHPSAGIRRDAVRFLSTCGPDFAEWCHVAGLDTATVATYSRRVIALHVTADGHRRPRQDQLQPGPCRDEHDLDASDGDAETPQAADTRTGPTPAAA